MGCTYCYESSVGFLTSILVFDWLVDNFFKLLLLACFIFAGLELLALPPPALGLLWVSFGPSSGLLRALFGPPSVLASCLWPSYGLCVFWPLAFWTCSSDPLAFWLTLLPL